MNALKITTLLLLLALISSCGDDSEEPSAESLIGTWSLVSFTADSDVSASVLGISITTTSNAVGSNFDYTITFGESDFTAAGSYDLTTTVTVDGEDFGTFPTPIEDASVSGTYTLNGNQLMTSAAFADAGLDDLDDVGDLPELQAATVQFNGSDEVIITQEEQMNITQDGVTSMVSISVSSTLRRQ